MSHVRRQEHYSKLRKVPAVPSLCNKLCRTMERVPGVMLYVVSKYAGIRSVLLMENFSKKIQALLHKNKSMF